MREETEEIEAEDEVTTLEMKERKEENIQSSYD